MHLNRRQLLPFLTIYCLFGIAHGDEQVRSIQEELRRRRIYFGDIDGRRTPELESALKRYQQRKGFGATGTDDRDTLRSLGLVPRAGDEPPPRELEWPQEPVLKSDTNIDVPSVAERVAEETGVTPESVAPEIVAERPKTKRSKKGAARPGVSGRGVGRPGAKPESAAGTSARRGRKSGVQQLTPTELREFVRIYLKAVERNDLREELAFYGDRVDYYHNGIVDRRIIERVLRDYYARWPKRRYSLGRQVQYAAVPSRAEIIVTFRVTFVLKRERDRVEGTTENRFVINAATTDPRIVKVDERRVRN